MFEMGAKVQVLKKGVLFPARANRLSMLYNQYNSLEELPTSVREQLEDKYFKRTLDAIWLETKSFFAGRGRQDEIDKARAQKEEAERRIQAQDDGVAIAMLAKAQVRLDLRE